MSGQSELKFVIRSQYRAERLLRSCRRLSIVEIAWRIMPILVIGYIIAYVDRVNVSFAKLQMLVDLKFSDGVYGVGAGIFFSVTSPSKSPATSCCTRSERVSGSAGSSSPGASFRRSRRSVRTPMQFHTARLLLGVAEAGFFPGRSPTYLLVSSSSPSRDGCPADGRKPGLPDHRRSVCPALSCTTLPAAGASAGWQRLFIVEAVPAIPLGVVIFLFLDNRVAEAKRLP